MRLSARYEAVRSFQHAAARWFQRQFSAFRGERKFVMDGSVMAPIVQKSVNGSRSIWYNRRRLSKNGDAPKETACGKW
jgi:hypothetical protein